MIRNLTLIGKISLFIGIICFVLGIFKLIQEISENTFILHQSIALALLSLGIGLTVGSYLYKKDSQ